VKDRGRGGREVDGTYVDECAEWRGGGRRVICEVDKWWGDW